MPSPRARVCAFGGRAGRRVRRARRGCLEAAACGPRRRVRRPPETPAPPAAPATTPPSTRAPPLPRPDPRPAQRPLTALRNHSSWPLAVSLTTAAVVWVPAPRARRRREGGRAAQAGLLYRQTAARAPRPPAACEPPPAGELPPRWSRGWSAEAPAPPLPRCPAAAAARCCAPTWQSLARRSLRLSGWLYIASCCCCRRRLHCPCRRLPCCKGRPSSARSRLAGQLHVHGCTQQPSGGAVCSTYLQEG